MNLGLHGKVQRKDFAENVEPFLQGLDVLVLSSWSEACPMAVLKTMAAGVPVVATSVGGVRELLEPGMTQVAGFVVKPGNLLQMAECDLELLNDPELCEAMGKCGRVAAEKSFSMERCQQGHLILYQLGTVATTSKKAHEPKSDLWKNNEAR